VQVGCDTAAVTARLLRCFSLSAPGPHTKMWLGFAWLTSYVGGGQHARYHTATFALVHNTTLPTLFTHCSSQCFHHHYQQQMVQYTRGRMVQAASTLGGTSWVVGLASGITGGVGRCPPCNTSTARQPPASAPAAVCARMRAAYEGQKLQMSNLIHLYHGISDHETVKRGVPQLSAPSVILQLLPASCWARAASRHLLQPPPPPTCCRGSCCSQARPA